MANPILIGLDIGTSGVKGLAMRKDGSIAASATREYPLITPRPGWAEQDPEAWWQGTVGVIKELLAATSGDPVSGKNFQ